MRNFTETLRVDDHAPPFTLAAANREGTFSLAQLISGSVLVLDFQRGTW